MGYIERVFYNDVAEKKRTARGIHAMTGKRGYVGKMIMPSDYMNRKDKKEYTRSGDVMVTNFYDDISNVPSREELEIKFKADPEGTRKMLTTIKEIHTWGNLAKHWGYGGTGSVATIWKKYGIGTKSATSNKKNIEDKPKRQYNRRSNAINTQIESITPFKESSTELLEEQKNIFLQQIQHQLINIKQNDTDDKEELFSINFNRKSISGENIANRLSYIVGVLECDVDYEINLTIKEKNQ